MPRAKGRAQREAHREDAELRQVVRDARSHEEQLEWLDDRLGIGLGAKRERARLERLIEQAKNNTQRTK